MLEEAIKLLRELKQLKEELQKYEVEQEYLEDPKPIQLVRRRKPRKVTYLRAKPYTAYRPTLNQIKVRLAFAEAAKKAKGVSWKGANKPLAAEMVKQELSGKSFGRTEKPKKWMKILSFYVR